MWVLELGLQGSADVCLEYSGDLYSSGFATIFLPTFYIFHVARLPERNTHLQFCVLNHPGSDLRVCALFLKRFCPDYFHLLFMGLAGMTDLWLRVFICFLIQFLLGPIQRLSLHFQLPLYLDFLHFVQFFHQVFKLLF